MREAGRIELRAICPDGRVSLGLFDDIGELEITIHDYRHRANLYATIQAPKLMPASNQVRSGIGGIRNSDIGYRIRIPFDLDAVRETDSQATPEQVECAAEVAIDMRRYLSRFDWPLPAQIQSGNGAHLVYRTQPLPSSPETDEMLKLVYADLDAEFSSAAVKIDTTVRSAGQIMRIPDSLNFKGAPDNPREVTIDLPNRWRQVQPRHIEALARFYIDVEVEVEQHRERYESERATGRFTGSGDGDYSTLNVVAWFTAHDHYLHFLEENKHAVRCPWQDTHSVTSPLTGSDSIIFQADQSWPGFYCHHDHCADHDIRDVFEIWGDADQFCSREFDHSAGRADR